MRCRPLCVYEVSTSCSDGANPLSTVYSSFRNIFFYSDLPIVWSFFQDTGGKHRGTYSVPCSSQMLFLP